MRWAVIAVCVATAACGKKSGSGTGTGSGSGKTGTASVAGSGSGSAVAASTFAIPQVSNDISKEPPSPRAEEYVLYDGKALRPIDVSALKGNPERGGRAYTIDSTGHLSPDP